MRRTIDLALPICVLLLFVASAFAGERQNKDLLIGKWAISETTAAGDAGTATFELRPDATFSGTAELNRAAFWTYSGTWTLKGNRLYWTYTTSSIPLSEEDRSDSDELVSVDGRTLVLISRKNGRKSIFVRQQ